MGGFYGVASLLEMRTRIGVYRHRVLAPGEDPEIGCLFIRDPVFFAAEASAHPPPDFSTNLIQGRSYDLAKQPAAGYFGELLSRLLGAKIEIDLAEPWRLTGPVFGDPRLSPYRLGQQAFQAAVLDRYGRRCAITGSKIRPTLQAAHIRPVASGGEHRIDNGLLLRSDVHTMFDRGYLGIDRKYRLHVSPRLAGEFSNGEQFYARAGQVIAVPRHLGERPAREFVEWHMEEVFLAS